MRLKIAGGGQIMDDMHNVLKALYDAHHQQGLAHLDVKYTSCCWASTSWRTLGMCEEVRRCGAREDKPQKTD